MSTIVVAAHKGGVGKTTVAVNLAASLAHCGKQTLLVDSDPQGAAATSFGISVDKPSLYEVISNQSSIDDSIIPVDECPRLSLLASDLDLAGLEVEAPRLANWQKKLDFELQKSNRSWDIVIIDTPPGLGILSTMALNVADSALIVCPPDYLSFRSLAHLQEVLFLSKTSVMGIVPTLVSKQSRHAREAFDLMEENYSDLILQSIPRRVGLQDAMVAGKPIINYLPNSDVSHAFLTLAKEVLRVHHWIKRAKYSYDMDINSEELGQLFSTVMPHLNEVQRRVIAGAIALGLGRGGKTAVARATGMSRNTVIKAEREIVAGIEPSERLRAIGGGDIKAEIKQPGLLEALDELVHPETRGNPMSFLRWTSKSTAKLADDLVRQGFKITDETVGRILKGLGYSLQAPAKEKEGSTHLDRDAQFHYLNNQIAIFMKGLNPVISVDTKKKELVGEYSNGGREYHPKGEPTRTKTHDFIDKELGRAVPYGVYDLAHDEGWVSVGDSADTSTFAVEAIRRWWFSMGKARFPEATKLLITADGGGSNGHRVKLWKVELAKLSKEIGLEITVCHYPPGTSKWNKIEHKMFSFISMNWRGRPLVSYRTIIELISATTTKGGLKIHAEQDFNLYETGTKVSEEEIKAIPLKRHEFHGDWNYTIAQSISR